jgi:hypothetical protein
MRDAYAFVDSVIQHAGRDAGMGYVWHGWVLRWAYLAGVRAERERCAKIAQSKDEGRSTPTYWNEACHEIAAAIRSGLQEEGK